MQSACDMQVRSAFSAIQPPNSATGEDLPNEGAKAAQELSK